MMLIGGKVCWDDEGRNIVIGVLGVVEEVFVR